MHVESSRMRVKSTRSIVWLQCRAVCWFDTHSAKITRMCVQIIRMSEHHTYDYSNHKQSAKITPRVPNSHAGCQHHTYGVKMCYSREQNPIWQSYVNLSCFVLTPHVSCWNSTRACLSYTRACRNHTRECHTHTYQNHTACRNHSCACWNHSHECRSHIRAYQNHNACGIYTLRVEITLVRVVITLVMVHTNATNWATNLSFFNLI
jgi:hypothetical protein